MEQAPIRPITHHRSFVTEGLVAFTEEGGQVQGPRQAGSANVRVEGGNVCGGGLLGVSHHKNAQSPNLAFLLD